MRLLFILLLSAALLSACDHKTEFKQVVFNGTTAEIDIRNLANNQPEFYSVNIDGRSVSFFVVLTNGEVQSYFNACLTCSPGKLGFRFQDGHIMCRSCNIRYPVDALKDGVGNCYPIKLNGGRVKDKYIFKKEDLMSGWKYFR